MTVVHWAVRHVLHASLVALQVVAAAASGSAAGTPLSCVVLLLAGELGAPPSGVSP